MLGPTDSIEHTAHGWWLQEAPAIEAQPSLSGAHNADVVIVGGGFAGMWTAWQIKQREPSCRVVVLEADRCGHGPSGRNGGFCETLWLSLPTLREQLGDERALSVARASSDSVAAIGRFTEEQEVDCWFRQAGTMVAPTASAQDGRTDAAVQAAVSLGEGERLVVLSGEEARARCHSERFRGGVLTLDDATVQPARLALGLRRRLLDQGVAIFERSRVRALAPQSVGEVTARTDGGTVRAGSAVLAINASTRAFAPLRARIAVTSSHIILTEPVPDVLDELGWTGGEAIVDGRRFVHYFRTTVDGRILFGWGGGRIAYGARIGGRTELDRGIVEPIHSDLVRLFPQLRGRRITHAWGGPIDVSPNHLPQVGTLADGRVHYVFGFTGNGVGPSHLTARALSAMVLGHDDAALQLRGLRSVRVPGEPFAWAGGSVVRAANLRKERIEQDGGAPDILTRALAASPQALGIHLGR